MPSISYQTALRNSHSVQRRSESIPGPTTASEHIEAATSLERLHRPAGYHEHVVRLGYHRDHIPTDEMYQHESGLTTEEKHELTNRALYHRTQAVKLNPSIGRPSVPVPRPQEHDPSVKNVKFHLGVRQSSEHSDDW